MTEDRRQFQRVVYECPALLAWEDHTPVSVEVENVSLKGVLIRGLADASVPAPGQRAHLEMQLSPQASIQMSLEVAFCAHGRLGAHWIEIDVEGMTHLRRLLALNLGDAEQVDRELTQMLHPE